MNACPTQEVPFLMRKEADIAPAALMNNPNSQSDLHIFPTRLQTVNGRKFQLRFVLMSCEANKWCKKLTWTRPLQLHPNVEVSLGLRFA